MQSILLFLLRVLVHIKRGLVWAGRHMLKLADLVGLAYRRTIGFWVFKLFLAIKKSAGWFLPGSHSILEHLAGKRSLLQLIVFLAALLLMLPSSNIGATSSKSIIGHRSLLFSLAGPGDEDFENEEILAADIGADAYVRSWREGAVYRNEIGNAESPIRVPEIARLSIGGNAIVKPTILTGASLPGAEQPIGRTAIAYYEVQPGDVIGQIAQKFGVQVSTILWANRLTARSLIRPGDRLKILPVDGVAHKVARGDTVSKIARLYSAKEQDIISFNTLAGQGSNLVIGDEVIVPNGVAPRPAAPASQVLPRIRALSRIVPPPPSIDAPAGLGYIWPTTVRRLTQYFGWRHTGLDIAGPVGQPLYAARSGQVVKSKCGWNGGYGCYVILDHGDGVQTLYGHASELYVSLGEEVAQGQVVAAMGSTGRSTGSHLHFEVRVNGRRMNPLRYVR